MPKRLAFLIGNQVFRPDSGLSPLQGPRNDIATLSHLLGDPERGNFIVRQFLDEPRHEILPEIEQALTKASPGDLVLIYYSGHGRLDRNGRVCLATADIREGALQTTSIPARHLTDVVNQSDCDQVILMLDCCYSGAIDDGSRGDVSSELRVVEDAQGFYILTASTDRETAKETEPLPGHAVMGRFTAAVVDGIATGLADRERKGQILLSDLRRYLNSAVVGQTPQFFARRAVGDPLISLSPENIVPLFDAAAIADLKSESWHRRLGAAHYLLGIARDGSAPARQAARAKLEQHILNERDVDVKRRIEEGLMPSAPQSVTAPKRISGGPPVKSEASARLPRISDSGNISLSEDAIRVFRAGITKSIPYIVTYILMICFDGLSFIQLRYSAMQTLGPAPSSETLMSTAGPLRLALFFSVGLHLCIATLSFFVRRQLRAESKSAIIALFPKGISYLGLFWNSIVVAVYLSLFLALPVLTVAKIFTEPMQ